MSTLTTQQAPLPRREAVESSGLEDPLQRWALRGPLGPDRLAAGTDVRRGPRPADPVQRVKVGGKDLVGREIASAVNDVGLTKGVKAKFIKEKLDDPTDYQTQEAADAALKAEAKRRVGGGQAGVAAVDKEGARTEQAAADIIHGKVNRDGNGRDVEWRFVNRATLEPIKGANGIQAGPETDQQTFERWHRLKDRPEVHSTPPDAYSATHLALAGGAGKFANADGDLTQPAAGRVRELITLCKLLEYKPVLVFSERVTCIQAQAVANTYAVPVEHLGEPD